MPAAPRISMSATTATHDECKVCGKEYDRYHSPGYCSEDCYWRERGDRALNLLRHDHRLCPTCGRWLKSVDTPPEEWKHDVGSAYQLALAHGAELHGVEVDTDAEQTHAVAAEVDGNVALDLTECADVQPTHVESVKGHQYRTPNAEIVVKAFDGPTEWDTLYQSGTGCECGTTDTRHEVEEIQGLELATVLANYVKRFRELEREGQLDKRISKDVFFSAYRDSEDLLYAIGRGIYDG